MANLPSSGPLSISDIKNLFGGPASPSIANYYRGGSYIPATKVVDTTVRQPATGEIYNTNTGYFWSVTMSGESGVPSVFEISFGGQIFYIQGYDAYNTITVFTYGGITYYRGSQITGIPGTGDGTFALWRVIPGTTTVNINTGIPSSGPISLSQFYNAEKP